MGKTYNILLMGASYGSLLASKLLFGGHKIHLVCLPPEADLINAEGFRVRLPENAAAGRDAIWVTSARDGTLTRYDPSSADLRTLDVGGTPTGLAVGDDSVWVAVAVA